MRKYPGMCSYYKGTINGQVIEAMNSSQLLRLASRIANKEDRSKDILYMDYVVVDDDMSESMPLPQEYFVRLSGRKWEYKGSVPAIAHV